VALEKDPSTLKDILFEGSRRARERAEVTLQDVRQAMKLKYD